MAKYIDAESLLKDFREWREREAPIWAFNAPKEYSYIDMQAYFHRAIKDAIEAINERPEEIVRCRDCKFYKPMTQDIGICDLACRHLGEDGFCSEGERKRQLDADKV